MKLLKALFCTVSLSVLLTSTSFSESVKSIKIYYDNSEPCITFAAEDLKKILDEKGIGATLNLLNELPEKPGGTQIIIAKNDPLVLDRFKDAGGLAIRPMGEQAYALRVTGNGHNISYWAIGGDRTGAMYGGIHIGEIVNAFGLDSVKNEDQSPYLAKRGIKFNIPLDARQPSHDDRGTSAQANVINVWDFSFWTEYLDVLARQRYNVLSLWNKHPFPSMTQVPDYPDIALNDVYNNSGKVKEISIDQKIELWKKVMDYAYDRGIEIYIITWNIHMNGTDGKYGITEQKDNDITKEYLRKSVVQLFLTYPRLAAIGVTAGENMNGMTDSEKEDWLWETYGKGVQEVQQLQPERHIRFIHRHWWTSFDQIQSRFSQLKDGFDMSFKYARARIYSAYNPPFAEDELLPTLPDTMSTWWTIRNDDIYNLRWGDPEYVKQFILHFPKGKKTAGYYMGSDRFVWARESISKNPTSPRMLENEKHWYCFLLWGRLGYDPETPIALLKGLINNRFPTVNADDLYTSWKAASGVIPLVNKYHWFNWDYLWWPEAGISTGYGDAIKGYHTISDFIKAPVMPKSNLISTEEYAIDIIKGQASKGITPLEVADNLEAFARTALEKTNGMSGGGNNELSETIGDIRAMGHLGNYYGKKIRGAVNLKLYQVTKDQKYKSLAVAELEESLKAWQEYARVLDKQYIKMDISMMGVFDWSVIEKAVMKDIETARNVE